MPWKILAVEFSYLKYLPIVFLRVHMSYAFLFPDSAISVPPTQGGQKILPGTKFQEAVWTLNVIAIIMDNEDKVQAKIWNKV